MKTDNRWNSCQTYKLERFAEIINGLNPCQKSIMKHFTNTVNGWNPAEHLGGSFLQK